jgi:ABC-type antimicrobial peptide transport system permease subunit
MSLVVRADSNSEMLVDAVREEVKRLDSAMAVSDIRLMNQVVDGSVATPRFTFVLMGLFATLAVLLAAIGTYGVISYSVNQRVPEFGLRIALGAQRSNVLGMVLFQAAKFAVAGTALGLIFALTLARVLRGLIYHVSPADPLTFTAVGFTITAIAMLACYLPAKRATTTDPMVAMRAE